MFNVVRFGSARNLIYGKIFIKSKSLQCSLLSDQRFYHKDVQGIWFLPLWYDGTMMRSLFTVLMLGCVMVAAMAANAAESVRPFTQGSLARVLEAREGRPFILMLWSLECQYCPTELKMLSELKRSHPKMDVVLIATDTVSDTPQLNARAESYGMKGVRTMGLCGGRARAAAH